MPTYMSYGYEVVETVQDGNAQKRVVFAISIAHKPGWLGWYVYVETVKFGAKEDALDLSNTPQNQGWEKINVLTNMRTQGGPVPFNLNTNINVNEFSGGKGHYDYPRDATAKLVAAKSGVHANVRISLRSEVADLLLPFDNATGLMLNDNAPRPGKLWLLGSTKFTPSAVNAGPVSTREAGNHTAFDRIM